MAKNQEPKNSPAAVLAETSEPAEVVSAETAPTSVKTLLEDPPADEADDSGELEPLPAPAQRSSAPPPARRRIITAPSIRVGMQKAWQDLVPVIVLRDIVPPTIGSFSWSQMHGLECRRGMQRMIPRHAARKLQRQGHVQLLEMGSTIRLD